MAKKTTHRMSGPAVVVGYLFMIPSCLGMLIGILFLVIGGGATASADESARNRIVAELQSAGVDAAVIEDVMAQRYVDKESLSFEQKMAVSSAEGSLVGSKIGQGAAAGLAFGFSLFMIVGSFIGGLLGYLLTMKKKVLQCGSCEAVVQAS
jgi:hypothetical protein